MKASVQYVSINREVIVEDSSCSLLDASIENKIPHLHECGGNGKCTTCRVRIIEGARNLTPKTMVEVEMSKSRRWDPSIRLACQCYIRGDLKVQRLIWSSAEINKIQKETVPEGKAEVRPLAILFCDLRNFTRLSEENPSFDVAYFLNNFYTALGDPILHNNGIIYQYVGDEIVGVFGTAGGNRKKNCMDAIRAALGMQYALERLNKIQLKQFNVKLELGIGINFGMAYVGHLGHPTHRQFSIIGDPVNVASRIEGHTKILEKSILISRSVYDCAEKDLLEIKGEYEIELSGKIDKTTIYELIGYRGMDLQLELQSSINLLLEDEDKFGSIFYDKVFRKAPQVQKLFKTNMVEQGRLLAHMLNGIVYALARPEYLKMGLRKLGESHLTYGVKAEYYPVVKEAILETIPEVIGDYYTTETGTAWSQAMDFVIDIMKSAAEPN